MQGIWRKKPLHLVSSLHIRKIISDFGIHNDQVIKTILSLPQNSSSIWLEKTCSDKDSIHQFIPIYTIYFTKKWKIHEETF